VAATFTPTPVSPSPTATATATPAPDLVIYDDATENGFQINDFDTLYNPASTTAVQEGAYALEASLSNWGTILLSRQTPVSTTTHDVLSFYVTSLAPGEMPFTVYPMKGYWSDIDWGHGVSVANYIPGHTGPYPGTWSHVTIPLADFGPAYGAGGSIYGVAFRFEGSGNYGNVIFDSIHLLDPAPAEPTPTPTATPTATPAAGASAQLTSVSVSRTTVRLDRDVTFKGTVKNTGGGRVYVRVVFVVYDDRGAVVDSKITTTAALASGGSTRLSAKWNADRTYVRPGAYRVEGTVYFSPDGTNFAGGNSLSASFSVR